jgi:Uma2 family endonuclease
MATHPQTATITLDDFIAAAEATDERLEFVDGRIVAMGGASLAHNLIVHNLNGILYGQLRGKPFSTVSQAMFVMVDRAENTFLPDVAVFCGTAEVERRHLDLLLNPSVLMEVLSPSTADYDHGNKWLNYRRIPSLQEYVLFSQDTPRLERFVRQGDGFWLFSEVDGLDAEVSLDSIGVTLKLAEVYEGVLAADGPSA